MKMSCYANVQETVPDSKNQSSMDRMKMIMTRPAFKWTAVAILITLVIITVVLPTVLEVTKQGNCYNLIMNENEFYMNMVVIWLDKSDFCSAAPRLKEPSMAFLLW